MTDNNFEFISESVAYENPFFTIMDRIYRLPDGSEHHYYIRKEVDSCCVLPMTSDGKFVVEREHRLGPSKELYQIPAGRLESFEDDPDERIKHELLEETGYTGEFKRIASVPASPYSTRLVHCYYAVNCEKVAEQKLDHTEFIEVELLDADTMRDILLAGKSSSCPPGMLAWEWLKKDGHL